MKKQIRSTDLFRLEIRELDDGGLSRVRGGGSLNIWLCANTGDCCDATNLKDCVPFT